MPISRKEVEHIARLARLRLTEDEINLFQRQLSDILDYAARLSELDTQQISPTATALPLRPSLRLDEVSQPMPQEELLKNAPLVQSGQFRTPPAVEGGS